MTQQLTGIILQEMEEKRSVKWYLVVEVLLSKTSTDGEYEDITAYFRSQCMRELEPTTIPEHLNQAIQKIYNSFEEFVQRGSGWTLEKVLKIELFAAKYNSFRASSYIPLPTILSKREAILNIQNHEDEKCFIWCVLAHQMTIHREYKPERVAHYTAFEDKVKMGDVTCPVPISKMPKLETLNNLRINVYGFEDKELFPLYISPRNDIDVINLLLISSEDNSHYCLIKNISRLISYTTKHDGSTSVCHRCLQRFQTQQKLDVHLTYCSEHSPQLIKMPEDNILQFTNVHFQHKLPYIIYADFEAIIVPLDNAQPSSANSYTLKTAHHIPCGYCFVIVGQDGKSVKAPFVYRGPDAVNHFLKTLIEEKNLLAQTMLTVKPLIMSPQQEEDFRQASHCTLCHKWLGKDRVKDHDHITGLYRGALHRQCNLQYRLRKVIPVVFHNLKHYDAHHIMQGLGKIEDHDFHVIANNMEKYISFSITQKKEGVQVALQFVDSLQFMASSLEKLVENLEPNQFRILKENVSTNSELLLRKGIYPYEYITSFQKFNETTLPSKDAFHSALTGQDITNEDYIHAQTVWNAFHIQNMGEYHDLYVKTDVLLLADVFQNFRNICQTYYSLDCAHMLTAPGLSWQACLKMSGQTLELLTDIDMYLFLEKGIRGGVSTITHRWAEANNKYMEEYDPSKPSKYILYLDANNLYGWAMSQYLPYGGFEWMSPDNITEEWLLNIPDDSQEGYIFEVDLTYPQELHDGHNDYPLAPEKITIHREMLSPYSKQLLGDNPFTKCEKLVPNLNNKKNYVVHYRNLKFYLTLGLQLSKVHKVVKFKQSPWLKTYIDFNTDKRKNGKNTFEKNFFKLMNNAVYGKTMENTRKRTDVQLVTSQKKAEKLVAAPTFHAFRIFNKDLVGVERVLKHVHLNKPIYVGFTVLELSKLHMYEFHYRYIKNMYGAKANLLFTDTDSLTYEVETNDVYEDMGNSLDVFDTSDYPTDHPLYNTSNKKVIGKFKDELNGKPILEFVGLRAKMYSLITADEEKRTAKGVCRRVVQKHIKHMHYKECLFNARPTRNIQCRIESRQHKLHTIQQNKLSLSPYDDKRYILPDGVSTLAYGHYSISENL